ncbi:MAG TPA: hypothetical protein VGF39_07970 [Stellaceae bacterium]|jgi:hypothetical protein
MYTLAGIVDAGARARGHRPLILEQDRFSNKADAIPRGGLANVGASNPGRKALDMLNLGHPDLDWVGLARSMGVPGARVTTMAAFNDRFAQASRLPARFSSRSSSRWPRRLRHERG